MISRGRPTGRSAIVSSSRENCFVASSGTGTGIQSAGHNNAFPETTSVLP